MRGGGCRGGDGGGRILRTNQIKLSGKKNIDEKLAPQKRFKKNQRD